MLSADAWTAEDQNYLNPPTPKRKSTHTPFRDEEVVFKIPMAPSPKSSPNPKPSIFTKLSPRLEPKSIFVNPPQSTSTNIFANQKFLRDTSTLQPSLSNVFGKSTFSDITPLNHAFQSTTNKESSPFSANIFGTSTPSDSTNLFGPSNSTTENVFKASNSTTRIFGDSSASSGLFSSFGQTATRNKEFAPNNFVTKNFHSVETNDENDDSELKQLLSEKQQIEMEIRKEEEAAAEQLKKKEREKVEREQQKKREMQEKVENERKENERIEEENANALQRRRRIQQISEQRVVELINEFVREELEMVAIHSLECYQQIENASEDVYYELLAEIIFEESAEWKRVHQEKIEKIENTPIWIPDKPLFELVPDLIHPLQDVTLNMSKRYRHGRARNLSCPTIHENVMNIFEIVPPQLDKTRSTIERIRKRPTFWKCGISIPSSIEDKSYQRIEKWLDKIFIRRQPSNSKLFFCEQQYVQSIQQDVAICLRKFRGSEMSNEDGIVDASDKIGLNALLFLMSTANPKETKRRLSKVLEYESGNCAIAIVMLNVDDDREPQLRSELELDDFIANSDSPIKYFYSKPADVVPSPSIRNKLLMKSLKFVAANFNFKSFLEMQSTTSFFDQSLGNQFWRRISTSSNLNPGLYKAATNVGFIIDIYNTALDHLDNLITEDLSKHQLFPQEFKRFVKTLSSDVPVEYQHFPNDWQNSNRTRQMHSFLMSLRLQQVSLSITTLDEIQEQLLAYAHRHINDKIRSDRAAYRMIQVLLEFCATNSDQTFQQQMNTFTWIDSMRLLSLEILIFQHEQTAVNIPSEVIYNREKFKQFLTDPWWLQNNGPMKKVRLSFDHLDEDGATEPKKPRLHPIDKNELEQLLARSAACLKEADRKINKFKSTVNTGREVTHQLDAMVCEHERNLRVQKRWSQMQRN